MIVSLVCITKCSLWVLRGLAIDIERSNILLVLRFLDAFDLSDKAETAKVAGIEGLIFSL